MATWTDSFERNATVASTNKTQVGTDINIPSGEVWTIIHLIGGTRRAEAWDMESIRFQE